MAKEGLAVGGLALFGLCASTRPGALLLPEKLLFPRFSGRRHNQEPVPDEKLARLYRLIEDGITDLDEVLKGRLVTLKAARDRAKAALERAKEDSASSIRVDPAAIERFSRLMSENFKTGSVPFRKAYLQALVDPGPRWYATPEPGRRRPLI